MRRLKLDTEKSWVIFQFKEKILVASIYWEKCIYKEIIEVLFANRWLLYNMKSTSNFMASEVFRRHVIWTGSWKLNKGSLGEEGEEGHACCHGKEGPVHIITEQSSVRLEYIQTLQKAEMCREDEQY